jgi:hypothetical protein
MENWERMRFWGEKFKYWMNLFANQRFFDLREITAATKDHEAQQVGSFRAHSLGDLNQQTTSIQARIATFRPCLRE